MNKRTTKARLIEILNRNLSPWTFDGSEPFTMELLALIESVAEFPAPVDTKEPR